MNADLHRSKKDPLSSLQENAIFLLKAILLRPLWKL